MNVIIKSTDLTKLLLENGFPFEKIQIADGNYVVPTQGAIDDFAKRYFDFLVSNSLDKWVQDTWDCDDFSFLAKGLASIDNALWQKENNNKGCSLAFGIAWIMIEQGVHAVNVAALKNSQGQLELVFFEPQIQQIQTGTTIDQNGNSQEITTSLCLQKIPKESVLSCVWAYF